MLGQMYLSMIEYPKRDWHFVTKSYDTAVLRQELSSWTYSMDNNQNEICRATLSLFHGSSSQRKDVVREKWWIFSKR